MTFHILRTRTGSDFKVAEALDALGVVCVAIVRWNESKHNRTKRKRVRALPLFAGYVFAHVPDALWPDVRRVAGVIAPLRKDGGKGLPATVSQETVARIQEASETGSGSDEWDRVPFKPGERVVFDLMARKIEATVERVHGGKVEASADIGGKRVTITRVAEDFGAVA